MRTRLPLALLLSGALVLSACGGGGDDASGDATDTPSATATDAAPSDASSTDPAGQAELVSEDLPEGVAATVSGTEISVEELEARLEVIRAIPQVEQQLEGDSADQVESQLQLQALGQLVLQEVVIQGAAGEDVEVTDEQVAERRSEIEDQAGGDEAFAEQLASAGVPEGQLDQELRASIAFEVVTEKLLADAGIDPTATPSEGGTASPPATPEAQQIQKDWLSELVSSTDVVVDEAYGAWNPATGQVVAG